MAQTTRDAVLSKLTGVLREGVDIHRCAAATALGGMHETDAIDALIDALHDEDEDVRTDAAAALSRLNEPRAVTNLMDNLIGDPCGEVKAAALKSLTQLRYEPVVPWLRKIVLGRDEEIVWDEEEFYAGGWDDWVDLQLRAIEALAVFKCEEAVPDIVLAMQDEMGQDLTEVGFKSLVQLGDAGVAAAVAALKAPNERLRRRVVRYLSQSDVPAAREALLGALADTSIDVRLIAAEALAEREPDLPALVALFTDRDEQMRELIVRLCGAAVPEKLEMALADKSHRVRRAVLALMTEQPTLMDAGTVMPSILKLLVGDAPKTAAAAAAALVALDPDNALAALSVEILNVDRLSEVRLAALRSSLRLDDPGVVDVLSRCVNDPNREIRLGALSGLAEKAGGDTAWPNQAGDMLLTCISTSPEADQHPPKDDLDAENSEVIPDPAENALATHAEDGSDEVEQAVFENDVAEDVTPDPGPGSTLESILGADSLELQVVNNRDSKVEMSPTDLEFLGLAKRKLKKRKRNPTLNISPTLDARRFAARVLGDVPREDVAEVLAQQVQGADIELAVNALDSLGRVAKSLHGFPPSVEGVLLDILNSRDENRRLLALRALVNAGGEAADGALLAALDDDDSFLRLEAVRALINAESIDRGKMEALLEDSDASVRLAAAQVLAQHADDTTLARLTDFAFAFEGYHHRETAKMLRRIDPVAASRGFLNVLDTEGRKREWQVAITALGDLNAAENASV